MVGPSGKVYNMVVGLLFCCKACFTVLTDVFIWLLVVRLKELTIC